MGGLHQRRCNGAGESILAGRDTAASCLNSAGVSLYRRHGGLQFLLPERWTVSAVRALRTHLPASLPRIPLRTAVLLEICAVSLAAYAYYLVVAPGHFEDFVPYRAAGQAVWTRAPLYAAFLDHPFPDPMLRPAFIYPPTFAVLPALLAWVPSPAAKVLWLLLMQCGLAAAAFVTYRMLDRPGRDEALLAAILTANFYPLLVDAWQGQVNAILLAAAALCAWALAVRRDALLGVTAAAAAAVKVVPAFWLLPALLGRRLRAIVWATVAGGAFAALGVLAAGWNQSLVYLTRVLPALQQGTAAPANQSLWGVCRRLFGADPYATVPFPWPGALPAVPLLLSVVLGLWWLWSRRRASQMPALAAAVDFAALLSLVLLAASVSWQHHFVLLLLPLWVGLRLLSRDDRRWSDTLAFSAAYACLALVPRIRGVLPGTGTPAAFLTENAVFAGTLILFLWLCFRLQRLVPSP